MNNYYVSQEVMDAGIPSLAFSIKLIKQKGVETYDQFIKKETEYCINKYLNTEPKTINTIIGYNELHCQYGAKSKKIKSAPESLINLLKKKGHISKISPLVDIYNFISIKYALALGAHDWETVKGNIVLKFASGEEFFKPIGAMELEYVMPGEYGYFDDLTNEVLCRLEARQSNTSKLTEASRNILFIIQGNKKTTEDYLKFAKENLLNNISIFYEFIITNEFYYLGENVKHDYQQI